MTVRDLDATRDGPFCSGALNLRTVGLFRRPVDYLEGVVGVRSTVEEIAPDEDPRPDEQGRQGVPVLVQVYVRNEEDSAIDRGVRREDNGFRGDGKTVVTRRDHDYPD